MSENTSHQTIQDGKPVNINISFNISRKQVTQNLNPFEQQRSFNLKNNIIEDNTDNNLKSRNSSFRPPKTPELPQTDRNIYSKDLEYIRPTQQLKRKKKRKRSSGDYTADKTSNFPFYTNDFQKSLPGHKRGYTTALIKKSLPLTATKSKRPSLKMDQTMAIKHNRVSAMIDSSKSQAKPDTLQKSLKHMINKIIKNELSKRSLPLPSVPNKTKYSQSTSLTSGKAKSSKKKSSKNSISGKQKQRANQSLQQKRHQSDPHSEQYLNKNNFLQKLSNFKSIQNSLLISQVDKMQQQQDINLSKRKSIGSKRIVIKTDQSIECIDQIHNYEKNKFRQEFFNQSNKKNDKQQLKRVSQTKNLIETYINRMYNQTQPADSFFLENNDPYDYDQFNQIPSNVNQKIEFFQNLKHEEQQNPLRQSDYDKIQELLNSAKRNDKNHPQERVYRNSPISRIEQIERNHKIPGHQDYEQQQIQIRANSTSNNLQNKTETERPRNIASHEAANQSTNQKKPSLSDKKPSQSKNESDQDVFRPFISSQMGRQMVYGNKQGSNFNSQQRARLNELKKHEIEKWGYLLQYIKSNMNKQANTQQVLQQVYEYLSQAKVDLIRQGQQASLQSSQSPKLASSLKQPKQRLEQEFTNRLSSQHQKSQILSQQPNYHHEESFKQKNGKGKQKDQSNPNPKFYNKQRPKSQQEEILDEEIRSFKDEYQSDENDEDMKFMNLETIESALKNRFKCLNEKKSREIQKLDRLYEQLKLNQQQYQEQKASVQKWFKHQTNQILLVKKNIWRGYNQAKGILDKSYINSRFEEQLKNKKNEKNSKNQRSSSKKDGIMMKCLSQSYLNKKKVDYKKFIQDEERKRQENQQKRSLQRQQDDQQNSQRNEDNQEYTNSQNEEDYDGQEQDRTSEYPQNDEQLPQYKTIQNKQSIRSQWERNTLNVSQQPESINDTSKLKSGEINAEDEMDTINKKLNKLKQQHQSMTVKGPQNTRPNIQQQAQSPVVISLSQKSSNLSRSDEKPASSLIRQSLHSPQSPSCSPLSPTSIHYEQLQKQLHSNTSSQYDQSSEKDYINEYDGKYDERSDEYQNEDEGQYNEEQQAILDGELSPKSDQVFRNKNKVFDKQSLQKDDSQNKRIDIGRQPQEQRLDDTKDIKKAQKNKKLSTDQLPQDQQETSVLNSQTSKQKASPQLSAHTKQLIKKFKYLTQQDKQDIFQFLFLDLCIELYQQPCQKNKIMASINNYITKQYEMSKRKKGVKTNLNVIKDYLKRFCGYVIRTNKKTLQNMNVPMGPTAIQMLKYMHENDDMDEEPLDQTDGIVTLIVPVSIFDTFERTLLPTLQFEKYYESQEKEQERVNFLKNILHIHNKALFDALNQYLDQQRPFGIWGKPFPWKKSSSFSHVFTQVEHQQKLKKSAQKVVEACSYVCGLLVDKQQSLVGNTKISQGYIEQIREDRISRMLANDMIQNQQRWVFYDDEQTEVLVESGNHIYNKLLKQCIEQLLILQKRQISLQINLE